jgi:hypothetical protein
MLIHLVHHRDHHGARLRLIPHFTSLVIDQAVRLMESLISKLETLAFDVCVLLHKLDMARHLGLQKVRERGCENSYCCKTGDDEHGDSNGLLIDFQDEHYGTCGGIILPPECKLEKLVQLEKSTELEHILQARFPGREHVRGSAHDVRVV